MNCLTFFSLKQLILVLFHGFTCSYMFSCDWYAVDREKEDKNQHTHPPSCRKMQAMYKHYKFWVCFLGLSPEPEKLLMPYHDQIWTRVSRRLPFADRTFLKEWNNTWNPLFVWANHAGRRTVVDRRKPSAEVYTVSRPRASALRNVKIGLAEEMRQAYKCHMYKTSSYANVFCIFSFLRILTVFYNHFLMHRLNNFIPGFMNCMWKMLIFM